MATSNQIARVIVLATQDATAQSPGDVERRATAFAQMLCGAMEGLDHRDAAAALRKMLGVRPPADGA
jgi:hypothetical protein